MDRTVTPYLSAIPWRVSVGHTVCFVKLSVRVMCLAVLPYFFRVLPASRMHLRSSISLAPFRSIVRPPGCSRGTGTHHNSSTYVLDCTSPDDPLVRVSHNLSGRFYESDDFFSIVASISSSPRLLPPCANDGRTRLLENSITYEARGTTTNHSGSWLSGKPSSHAWNDVHACTGNLVIALGIIDDSRLVSRRLSVRSGSRVITRSLALWLIALGWSTFAVEREESAFFFSLSGVSQAAITRFPPLHLPLGNGTTREMGERDVPRTRERYCMFTPRSFVKEPLVRLSSSPSSLVV